MLTRRMLLGLAALASIPLPGSAAAEPRQTATSAPPTPAADDALATLLGKAKSWAYQLQGFDIARLAASPADILVVDYSISGQDRQRFSKAALRRLQRKPDGSRRIVLAYMSIGEAEEYRYYWKPEWIETAEPDVPEPQDAKTLKDDGKGDGKDDGKGDGRKAADKSAEPGPAGSAAQHRHAKPGAAPPLPPGAPPPTKPDRWPSAKAPPWLGDENDAWSGNFAVRFEHPDWQAIFLQGADSYLARLVAAGFDGVYLDRVDAYYDHIGNNADPGAEMVAFVRRIAETARQLKPGFLMVPQNGEELLLRPGYVGLIDAIAKEDLLYGSPTEGEPNSNGQIVNSVGWLGIARRKGRPVLVVEYLSDPQRIAKARFELDQLGYIATFAPRLLDTLTADAVRPAADAPTSPPAAPPAPARD